MMFMVVSVVLITSLIAVLLTSAQGGHNDKFICSQNKCIQAKFDPNETVRYDFLELCRLVCSEKGNLWPLPTKSDLGHSVIEIDPSKIHTVLENASVETRRYMHETSDILFSRMYSKCSNLTVRSSATVLINLRVSSSEIDLNLETDESYKLSINNHGKNIDVEINATSVFGARHGLETLSQLTATQTKNGVCSIFMLTKAEIKDKPVFKHRGLLIDTARTFLPVRDIKRTIDGMGSVKLNVLHWHATDTHSFPLSFDTLPQLAEIGAYSEDEVYTTKDMRDIVEYAKLRGVRVILEIDSPGHAGNGWQFGESEGLGKLALCVNKQPWIRYCNQSPCGQMNPANPSLYYVLGKMYKEISSIFQQEMFHMGGDEVSLPCWLQSVEISKYMDQKGFPKTAEAYVDLWGEFHNLNLQTWDRAVGHSKTRPILWSSHLTSPDRILKYLDPKRFVIETWVDAVDPLPVNLTSKGYSLIYATHDVWYLDHGFWGGTKYSNWMRVYDQSIPHNDKVLGGEACMWGELASKDNLDMKIWPRAAALAERLWSYPNMYSIPATYRLLGQMDRLFKLGIQADQITPQWCALNEGRCS